MSCHNCANDPRVYCPVCNWDANKPTPTPDPRDAEIAALKATIAKVREVATTLAAYPTDEHCGTCGQPDTDTGGGLLAVRRWQEARNWRGCGNVWHQSQDLRRIARKRTTILAILDGGNHG